MNDKVIYQDNGLRKLFFSQETSGTARLLPTNSKDFSKIKIIIKQIILQGPYKEWVSTEVFALEAARRVKTLFTTARLNLMLSVWWRYCESFWQRSASYDRIDTQLAMEGFRRNSWALWAPTKHHTCKPTLQEWLQVINDDLITDSFNDAFVRTMKSAFAFKKCYF